LYEKGGNPPKIPDNLEKPRNGLLTSQATISRTSPKNSASNSPRPKSNNEPPRDQYTDFGAPDQFGTHLFLVEIPAARSGAVVIVED
jgi:hypothetical protein